LTRVSKQVFASPHIIIIKLLIQAIAAKTNNTPTQWVTPQRKQRPTDVKKKQSANLALVLLHLSLPWFSLQHHPL
jgi:hypothetical protein